MKTRFVPLIPAVVFALTAQAGALNCESTYEAALDVMKGQVKEASDALDRRETRGMIGAVAGGAAGCYGGIAGTFAAYGPHNRNAAGMVSVFSCFGGAVAAGALGHYVGQRSASQAELTQEKRAEAILRAGLDMEDGKFLLQSADVVLHKDTAEVDDLVHSVTRLQIAIFLGGLQMSVEQLAQKLSGGDASGAVCADGHPMGQLELLKWVRTQS